MKTTKKITAAKCFRLAKYFTGAKTLILLSALSAVLILASCSKGRDGRDGMAFMAVNWDVDAPDYIDVGNPSFPQRFFYDEFYRVNPGHFLMYYEGVFWNGYAWAAYAWDIEYEIWENRGEPGSYHYDGYDGEDNYFTIRCTPYGPYNYQLKMDKVSENNKRHIEDNGDTIIVQEESGNFTMRIVYKKAAIPNKLSKEVH